MLFPATTAHGFYAIMYLADRPNDCVSAAEVASALRLPRGYAAKVLQALAAGGVLKAFCGRRGGYCLARPLSRLNVAAVFQALGMGRAGDRLRPRRCAGGLSSACGAHAALVRLEEKVWQALADEPLDLLAPREADAVGFSGDSRSTGQRKTCPLLGRRLASRRSAVRRGARGTHAKRDERMVGVATLIAGGEAHGFQEKSR